MNNENTRKEFETWAEPRGFMIESYQGQEEEWFFSDDDTQLNFECWQAVLSKLAAETLRADTAEAELEAHDKTWTKRFELICEGAIRPLALERNSAREVLAAAEQREEELFGLLEHAYGAVENSKEWRWLIDRIDAALNPKPEAGSHE